MISEKVSVHPDDVQKKKHTYKELFARKYEYFRSGLISEKELDEYASRLLTEMCVYNKSVNDTSPWESLEYR